MPDANGLQPDTYLTVPDATGMQAAVMVTLLLDVHKPDLAGLDDLLDPDVLEAMARAVTKAQQPYPWAAEHIGHAVDHLLVGELTNAWPPLVIRVEGLYWGEAEQEGFVDNRGPSSSCAMQHLLSRSAAASPPSVVHRLGAFPLSLLD